MPTARAWSRPRGIVTLPERITPARLLLHPAGWIALGGGAGLLPAPGTFGTLLALPVYWWLLADLPFTLQCLLWLVLAPLCAWAAGFASRRLDRPDPGAVVVDETHAFLGMLIVLPPELFWQALGFLLFRVLDIAKPPPIRGVDRRTRGGLGIMLDDWLAAGLGLLLLALLQRLTSI